MSSRPLALMGVLALVVAVSLVLVASVHAQSVVAASAPAADSWTARTPWGHPELQGVWASDSFTPLQRPKQLADMEYLADQEAAVLRERAAELFSGDTDAAFGDSVCFTRLDADTLQYEFTMHDPTTWTRPWTARIFMKPAPGTGLIYEFACHEGNYALGHALRGARAQEKTAAK